MATKKLINRRRRFKTKFYSFFENDYRFYHFILTSNTNELKEIRRFYYNFLESLRKKNIY